MLSESEWMYERYRLYKLMQDCPGWSLRAYARTVQHDLTWVRKWANRLEDMVTPTVGTLRSHSRKPKHSPTRLDDKVKDAVCTLREQLAERFNRPAGAETIQYFMKDLVAVVPCAASIYAILHERGYVQPPQHAAHFPIDS